MKAGFISIDEEAFIEMKVSSTCTFNMANRPCSRSPRVVELPADRLTPITSPPGEVLYKEKLPQLHPPQHFIAAKSVGSCKISPSESYKDSSKYVAIDSSVSCRLVNEQSRKPSGRKINLSSIRLKFNASQAYLGKLLTKTSNSNQSSSSSSRSAGRNAGDMEKQIQRDNCERTAQGVKLKPIQHRRSFSGAIKRSLTPTSISPPNRSSFSGRVSECQHTNRRDSEISDIEKLIQGAIAHCKQSQFQSSQPPRQPHSSSAASAVGF